MPTRNDIRWRDSRDTEKKIITPDDKSQRREYFSLSLFLLISSMIETSKTRETSVANKVIMSTTYLLRALIISIKIASTTFII